MQDANAKPETTPKKRTTHGSPELDEDAAKLAAMGADPGPTFIEGEPLLLCWHGCLYDGVECTYPDCLSETP